MAKSPSIQKTHPAPARPGSYTRVDWNYHFHAALGEIKKRAWTRQEREIWKIDEELFLCEEALLARAKGFRNNAASHPNGNFFAIQEEKNKKSTGLLALLLELLIKEINQVACILRMQAPPPPVLPAAQAGHCLAPRLLPAPAAMLAG